MYDVQYKSLNHGSSVHGDRTNHLRFTNNCKAHKLNNIHYKGFVSNAIII